MPETQGSKVRLRLVGHGASFYKVIREKRSAALHILDCQQHRQDNNAMDEVRANEACTSRPKGPFQSSPTQRMHAVDPWLGTVPNRSKRSAFQGRLWNGNPLGDLHAARIAAISWIAARSVA